MVLTEEERSRALELKQACEDDDDIITRGITDFQYAQIAIVDLAEPDLERSIHRVCCLQEMRKDNNINDNVEEGLDVMRTFIDHQPGFLLDVEERVDYSDGYGAHNMMFDFGKMDPKTLDTRHRGWRTRFAGLYYIQLAMGYDFERCRQGYRHMFEVEGVGRKNVNFIHDQKMWTHFFEFYPMAWKQCVLIRPNWMMQIWFSMMKAFTGKLYSERFVIGVAKLEDYPDRLDELYFQPDYNTAMERLFKKMKRKWIKRFENEASFKL